MSALIGNPLLLPDEGYNISRSVRLRSSASAYFNKTNSSSPTDSRKWTWSGWVKRGSLSATQNLLSQANSGSDDSYLQFGSSDKLVLGSYSGAGTDYGILTSGLFRDPSAWYHIVAVLDTANATAADRGILYVNGVRQTVTNSANGVWPQNSTNNKINTASQVVNIGRRPLGDTYLALNKYHPVSFGDEGGATNPEEAKVKAMNDFVDYIKGMAAILNKKAWLKNDLGHKFTPTKPMIGFSDDDPKNVEVMRKAFKDKPDNLVKTYSTAGGIKKEVQ